MSPAALGPSVGPDALTLLAYPLTPELLGTVHVYDFPDEVQEAWDQAREDYQATTGSYGNLPFAGLATALRAVGRTSLNFEPTSKNTPPRRMITRSPLRAEDLHDAVTIWHQAAVKVPDADIRLSFRSKLAQLIGAVRPSPVPLADHISYAGSQPDAPSWVYAAATWEIAQRIQHADTPWIIDGRPVPLRADTDGNLIVWDPDLLWEGRWHRNDPPSYATLRIELRMKTLPRVRQPVVVVVPSASRLTRWSNAAGNAWLEPRDPDAPLLALDLENSALEYSSRIALRVFAQLRAQPVPVTATDFDLTDRNGPVKALVPKSVRFPIGRGVGMHLVRELSSHLTDVLATPPLTAHNVAGHKFSKADSRTLDHGRDTELLHPDELPAILDAAGCDSLRIHVLYQEDHTRARIQRLLAYHFSRPDLAEHGITASEPVELAPGIEVVIQRAKEVLAHGGHDERPTAIDKLKHLDPPAGSRSVALCETDYDEEEWAKQRKLSRRKGSQVPNPDETDAKPVVRRLLAERGIAAQFLATGAASSPEDHVADSDGAPDPGPGLDDPVEDDEDVTDPLALLPGSPVSTSDPLDILGHQLRPDHPGHNAIADMLRAAGLVHPRLGRALAYGQHGTSEPLAFVGLNVREQRGERRRSGKPHLSWSLVVLIPNDEHWRVKAYIATAHPRRAGTGWHEYTDANLAFHANHLPEGKRRDADIVAMIDTALSQLEPELTGTAGYVLFVSGENARTLWPRLANKNLERQPDATGMVDGRPALPAARLPRALRPRAVVRVTSGSSEIPRPVRANKTKIVDGAEVTSTTKTTRALYRLDDARDTWILSNVPRQFDGKKVHSRAGSRYSRWNAQGAEQRKTWYAHTPTEIFVADHDGDPLRYAVAAARLCHHALSWEGRTRYPAPIHLAVQMDKDHPEYRKTIDATEEIDLDAEPDPGGP